MNKNNVPFDEEQNQKIYHACNAVRAFMVVDAANEGLKGAGGETNRIVKIVMNGSIIFGLITKNNWEELFKNADWIEILETTQNLNSIGRGGRFINEHLKTIKKFFPKETEMALIALF